MEEVKKKTSITGRLLVWFLIVSTGMVVYITIKLLVVSYGSR